MSCWWDLYASWLHHLESFPFLFGVFQNIYFILFCQGSRKINYKSLMKDCMAIICQLSQLLQGEFSKHLELQQSSQSKLSRNCHFALSLSLFGVLKDTCVSMEKLLVMVSSWTIWFIVIHKHQTSFLFFSYILSDFRLWTLI